MIAILKNKLVSKILIILIIFVIIYFGYKKIKKDVLISKEKAEKTKEKAEVKAKVKAIKADNEIKLHNVVNSSAQDTGGNIVGNVSTYTKEEFVLMANSLFQAMKGWGTDEQTIFSVLSALRTKSDWLSLVDSFGTKYKMGLSAWLTSELGGADKSKANELLSKFNVRI